MRRSRARCRPGVWRNSCSGLRRGTQAGCETRAGVEATQKPHGPVTACAALNAYGCRIERVLYDMLLQVGVHGAGGTDHGPPGAGEWGGVGIQESSHALASVGFSGLQCLVYFLLPCMTSPRTRARHGMALVRLLPRTMPDPHPTPYAGRCCGCQPRS